jgi:hypothetical protein
VLLGSHEADRRPPHELIRHVPVAPLTFDEHVPPAPWTDGSCSHRQS